MKNALLSFCSLSAMVAVISTGGPAYAQSMDYESLSKVFGESVTVNATGTPQRAGDVAANMTIITADQIRQSGSRSIPQIIGQYVTGVDVLQTGYAGYDIGVRRYLQAAQPRLLVLVDGRQVFIDDYSRTIWNNIPVNIDDIRQIEVVKGPASALFGSNAASGVINIITYSPVYDKNNVVAASFGTQSLLTGDGTVTKNGEWGGTKFSVGGLEAEEFNTERTAADSPIVYDPDRRYITNSSILQLTPDLTANGELTYSESKQNQGFAVFDSVSAEKTATYSIRGGLSWQTDYGVITNDNYLNHTFDSFTMAFPTTEPNDVVTDLFVSSLNDKFEVGSNNTFRVGLEFRHKDFKLSGHTYTNAPYYIPNQAEYAENNYAVSGTWVRKILDNLTWTNSVRWDHQDMEETGTVPSISQFTDADFSHSINTWSANSALVYKATDKDSFRASYGRGVQMPSLIQSSVDILTHLPASLGGVPLVFQGNPDLEPTITQGVELGYDRKVPEIFSTVKLTAFYQLVENIATLTHQGVQYYGGVLPYVLIGAQNVGDSTAYGGEFELLGNYQGFRWGLGYSFARITDDGGVLESVNYQGSSPQHHVRLNAGYTYKDWEFDMNGQGVTSTDFLRSTDGVSSLTFPTGGYVTVGGRIGYNLMDNFTVAVSGTNINRERLETSPYPAIERQGFLTLTGKF